MTRQECEKIIKWRDEHQYTLRHGEYARPESKVRKVRSENDYGIYTKYNYYAGTFGIPKDGREDENQLIQELMQIEEIQRRWETK